MRQLLSILTLVFVLCHAPFGLTADITSHSQLKADYLYNFAKFIYWPEDTFANAHSPFIIGVLGENSLNAALTPLTGRKVRNRSIEILHFKNVQDIQSCQLLYISPSTANDLQETLKSLSSKRTITIGDDNNFATLGGAIQFVTSRERLDFIVNLKVIKEEGIKIDSQLLSLAIEILESQK